MFSGINSRNILNAQPCCKRRHDDLTTFGEVCYRAMLGALAIGAFIGALVLSGVR